MRRCCFSAVLSVMALVCVSMRPACAADIPTFGTPESRPRRIGSFVGPIRAADVRPHVEYLASPELQGRSGAGARLAAKYIVSHFRKWGLKPLFKPDGRSKTAGSYYQPIPGRPITKNGHRVRPLIGRNVGAWIPGRDPALRDDMVIVSAHYDHLGVRNGRIYRGADDNASGVSMLLEVARQIAKARVKPRRSIVFIGFDLEEHLLWGSRWFAAHPPWPLKRVKLFITADMIGRSLGNLPLPAVFVLGSEHAPQLKRVLDHVGTPRGLDVARLGTDLIGTRSDYGPFRDRKIPYLFFSTGEHPDYHTPDDVPERVDYKKVARVSGLVLRVCRRVADAQTTPRWTDALTADLDEARALNRIATLLLAAQGQHKLTAVQRIVVTTARDQTRQIIDRGKMSPGERSWLIGFSQFMLLSVF